MSTFIWRAVRCCCQPTKLLGFLRLPDRRADLFTISDHAGARHTIQLRPITECEITIDAARHAKPSRAIERELAVYSEDRGVEFWRTIPDFVEVKDAAP